MSVRSFSVNCPTAAFLIANLKMTGGVVDLRLGSGRTCAFMLVDLRVGLDASRAVPYSRKWPSSRDRAAALVVSFNSVLVAVVAVVADERRGNDSVWRDVTHMDSYRS